jgi:phospholipase/lecithinase/hemolysin
VIEIGGNDVRDALIAAAEGQDPEPYIVGALESLSASIVALYEHGARRFLLLNVGDIGKTPAVQLLDQTYPGTAYSARELSKAYNQGLGDLVDQLAQDPQRPGVGIKVVDAFATVDSVVADPESYGFVNVSEACVTASEPPFQCHKPDTYVFWDGIHPTSALHAIVAQEAISQVSEPW